LPAAALMWQGSALAAQHTTVGDSPSAVTAVSDEDITELPKRPIDELVTTARRTEENVLEVPLAITTFSADALEEAQITDLTDVAGMTPGFSFQNYFGQDLSVPTIRGVSQINIFGDPNAPVFIDGIYVSSNTGINFSFLDVQRIEVLRGPQPAYFGYQSFSGAVNFVSARPADELQANVELTVGSDDKARTAVSLSGPLVSDWLSGRASLLYDDFGGTYRDASGSDQDIGGYQYNTFAGALYFTPGDTFSAQWNLYLSNDQIDPPALGSIPANCEPELDDPNDPSSANPDRLLNYCGKIPSVEQNSLALIPGETGQEREVWRTNLILDWDVGFGTFSSLTGYSETRSEIVTSAARGDTGTVFAYQTNVPGFIPGSFVLDTFSAPLLQPTAGKGKLTDFSQEIRYTSPQENRARFTVGAYYRQTQSDIPNLPNSSGGLWAPTSSLPDDLGEDVIFPGFSIPAFCPCAPFGPPGSPGVSAGFGGFIFQDWFADEIPGFAYESTAEDELWAAFGSVAFDLTDQWTVYAEARYTDFEEKFNSRNPDDDPADWKTEFTDDFFNWRTSLEYHPNELSTVYVSAATGSKQGGLESYTLEVADPDCLDPNDPNYKGPACESLNNSTINTEYQQEEITTYELGYKAAYNEGRTIIETSIYYSDWQDLVLPQVFERVDENGLPTTDPDGIGVETTSFSSNIGDASITGFEFALNQEITDWLNGGFGVSWNKADFDNGNVGSFVAFPSFAPDGDMSGQTLLRQPERQVNANLTIRQPLAGDWDWYSRADVMYQSEWYVGLPNQATIPSRTRVNLRIGTNTDNYTIEVWANNLFDDDTVDSAFRDVYLSNALPDGTNNFSTLFPFRLTVTHPERRTVGVTLRGKF
jgi:iron complex outermembrane receptor protein